MNFFNKLFGMKNKEKQTDVGSKETNSQTFFSATAMSTDDLNKLKVGDTIQLGNKSQETFELKWIEPNDNPFKIKIFDCREYAINRFSTTKNPEITAKFLETRRSNGTEYIGKFPNNGVKVEVDLNFHAQVVPKYKNGIPDGVLFKAQTMEEKWDIYKYSNFIFFVRSWTGELVYFSNYIPTAAGFKVELIVLDDSKIDEKDPYFELKVVEFLIHSHILDLQVPHPIPLTLENKPEAIAAYSFSMFGNRGYFASYD